jgi:hypothetical protein
MLRFPDPVLKEEFDLVPRGNGDYLKSSYLKKQDAPPLGLNAAGRVSPVRPMFIALYSDIGSARRGGGENRLLAAEWRAFAPHTIQRGGAGCAACHGNPRRFLAEPEGDSIHLVRNDGIPLDSFWSREGQRVVNGGWYPPERLPGTASRDYIKGDVESWRKFLGRDVPSSPR